MIDGVLGIIDICGYNFLICITGREYIGKLDTSNIYAIKSVEFFEFYQELQGYSNPAVKNYIDGMKKILTLGCYFSYHSDLTSNR